MVDLKLPSDGMKGKNGIAWGWDPDDDQNQNIEAINSLTKKKASTYGRYAQIQSASGWDGAQLIDVLSDVKKSGAVFIAHVMPTGVPFSKINESVANSIADIMKKVTSEDIVVWLRFAHEMNWYASKQGNTYHGTAAEFVTAWKTVYAAVHKVPNCLMFWSPNVASPSDLEPWFPGAEYVDIVGMDKYVSDANATFANTFGEFYSSFAAKYNKPMALGETGPSTESNVNAIKENWVKQLANTDLKAYPLLKSVTWFEYNKGGVDFRLIVGQSAQVTKETMSNFH